MRLFLLLCVLLQSTTAWIPSSSTARTSTRRWLSEPELTVSAAITTATDAATTTTTTDSTATTSLTTDLVSKLRYRELKDELSQRALPQEGTTSQLRDRLRQVAIVECNLTETGELDQNCQVRGCV